MSKPDFFLPFHLPMVLDDINVLNIECKPFYYDHPIHGINSKYFCQARYDEWNKKAMQKIIIPLRLKCGVYQTIRCIFPQEGVREFCRIINKFSISLN